MTLDDQEIDQSIVCNVAARRVANEIMDLGITLAKEEGLAEYPESVRKMWKHVMENCAELIGEELCQEKGAGAQVMAAKSTRTPVECVDDDEPFPFGKYKDQPYSEVPDSYFEWLAEQDWIQKWHDVWDYIQANDLG